MGFALWVDDEVAWAQGTHEYRPMGTAVIGVRGLFTSRDFSRARRAPERQDQRFVGHFASTGDLNDFLVRFRSQSQQMKIKLRQAKSLGAPYF